jgi:hypothetical protein
LSSNIPNTTPGGATLDGLNSSIRQCMKWLPLLLWGGALYATLSLSHLRGSWSNAFCGPWGCSAPLEALLSCHLSWLFVLGSGFWFFRCNLPINRLFWLGFAATVSSIVGIAALLTVSAIQWYERTSGKMTYIMQHLGLELVGLVDLPLLELLIIGCVSLGVAHRCSCRLRKLHATHSPT